MIATISAPLGATSPQAALALYDLARTSGAASAYEAAAHALARAMQRQMTIAATLRPAVALSAALGAPSEAPMAAPVVSTPKRRSAKVAQVEDDLTALFTRPTKAKATTGSFWVVWSDGTATRVCGVVYHSGKSQQRWAAALNAADTLRRLRNRRELARQLEAMSGGPLSLTVRTSCNIEMDSPDWQRLAMVAPMPSLAAIYDEATGETFEAPPAGRYGAGDAAQAGEIMARLIKPRLFWRRAEIAAQGWTAAPTRMGLAYEIEPGKFAFADSSPDYLTIRRADALAAWAVIAETPAKETASAGDRPPENMFDLDGLAVVIAAPRLAADLADALAAWNEARAPLKVLREAMQDAREIAQRPNATPDDVTAYGDANEAFSAALAEEQAAERRISKARGLGGAVQRFATNEAGELIRWTAKRLAGGFAFRLTASDGDNVTLDAAHAKALRLAA